MKVFRQLWTLPETADGVPMSEYEFASLCTSRVAVISWWFIALWLVRNVFMVSLSINDLALINSHGVTAFGCDLLFVLIFLIGAAFATFLYFRSSEKGNVASFYFFNAVWILVLPLFIAHKFTSDFIPYYFFSIIIIHLAALLLNKYCAVISIMLMGVLFKCDMILHFSDSSLGGANPFRNYLIFLWLFIAPFATIYMRNVIFPRLVSIDNSAGEFFENEKKRISYIRGVNEVDPINIALHGTILNTLVVLDKTEFLTTPESLATQIKKDLEIFQRAQSGASGSLGTDLIKLLEETTFKKVQVKVQVEEYVFLDPIVKRLIVETAREMIINIDRHTRATQVSLTVIVDRRGEVSITTVDNSLVALSLYSYKEIIDQTQSSITLKRLLRHIVHTRWVQPDFMTGELAFHINLLPLENERRERNRLALSRNDGIHGVARFLIITAAIFSLGFIPLYFQGDLALSQLMDLEALPIVVLFAWLIFQIRDLGAVANGEREWLSLRENWREVKNFFAFARRSCLVFGKWSILHKILIIFALLSPVGLCLMESHQLTCQTLQIGNWMFINILFMLCGAALISPSTWMKIGICMEGVIAITFINLHQSALCRQYPAGAFGFLILGVVAISTVVYLRRLSIKYLHLLINDVTAFNSETYDLLSGIVQRRNDLISRVEEYFAGIVSKTLSWSEILSQGRILKTSIRNFLVASEYFDIPLHIELFDLMEKRTKSGALSKMEIYGTPPTNMGTYFNYRKHLKIIEQMDVKESVVVEIVYDCSPLINIYAGPKFYESFDIKTKISGEIFEVNFQLASLDQLP